MRREVMADVRQLQAMLENHVKEGACPPQTSRSFGAARHSNTSLVITERFMSTKGAPSPSKDALIGINQLIDEDADKGKEPTASELRADDTSVPANLWRRQLSNEA